MTNIPVAPGELVDTGYLNEVARAHYRKTSSKKVVSTVTATDLLNGEITIGAGAMATARGLRLTAWGDALNNTGSTQGAPEFLCYFGASGGILAADTGTLAATWGTSAQRFPWRIVVEILNQGATNAQWASMHVKMAAAIAAAAAAGTGDTLYTAVPVASSLGFFEGLMAHGWNGDTTAACNLILDVKLPVSNANCDVTLQGATVEIV